MTIAAVDKAMKHVNFLPWVGKNYQNGFQGLRTLILGESQYTSSCDNPFNFTIERVKEQINGACSGQFWTNIAKALIGSDPVLEDKKQFWNSVSFYNYVQEFVGDGPRIRPTEKHWKSSETPFVEVLEELKPEFILALGYQMWESLPFLNSYEGPKIEGASTPATWIYPHLAGSALAYCVKHPSSGFSALTEHPYILIAMNKAKELKQSRRESIQNSQMTDREIRCEI
jgi:hypothetical protein